MEDKEINIKIGRLHDELYQLYKEISEIKTPPEAPILFQGDCIKCGHVTTHRSYYGLSPKNSLAIASTTMVSYYRPPELLKVCLNCGIQTYMQEGATQGNTDKRSA